MTRHEMPLNLQLLLLLRHLASHLMGSQAEMVRGSKPVSPTQVPSKAGVSGRPANGMAVTPLPWIFPSPKSCIEVLVVAAALLPGCGTKTTSTLVQGQGKTRGRTQGGGNMVASA